MNGPEILIADQALDTMYVYSNHQLNPVIVKSPPIKTLSPPMAVAPMMFTDSYFHFNIIKMEYNPSEPYKPINEKQYLYLDRKTGQIKDWSMMDPNYSTNVRMLPPSMEFGSCTYRNCGIDWYSPKRLLEQYEKDKLKGELKEIASKLQMDDNNVLVIYTFKE